MRNHSFTIWQLRFVLARACNPQIAEPSIATERRRCGRVRSEADGPVQGELSVILPDGGGMTQDMGSIPSLVVGMPN